MLLAPGLHMYGQLGRVSTTQAQLHMLTMTPTTLHEWERLARSLTVKLTTGGNSLKFSSITLCTIIQNMFNASSDHNTTDHHALLEITELSQLKWTSHDMLHPA